jgi:hypothetical protein
MTEAEFYRGDAAELLRWGSSDSVLQRYREYLEADLPSCGDARLIRLLRRLQQLLARLQVHGLENCASQDRAAAAPAFCESDPWSTTARF